MTSRPGLRIWLGDADGFSLHSGAVYRTASGTAGQIRSIKVGERLRLTWKPSGWQRPSMLQIYLLPIDDKTAVRFDHEQLADAKQREAMRRHWQDVLNRLLRLGRNSSR